MEELKDLNKMLLIEMDLSRKVEEMEKDGGVDGIVN